MTATVVPEGLAQALEGMHAGGVRLVVLPPDLAYGVSRPAGGMLWHAVPSSLPAACAQSLQPSCRCRAAWVGALRPTHHRLKQLLFSLG